MIFKQLGNFFGILKDKTALISLCLFSKPLPYKNCTNSTKIFRQKLIVIFGAYFLAFGLKILDIFFRKKKKNVNTMLKLLLRPLTDLITFNFLNIFCYFLTKLDSNRHDQVISFWENDRTMKLLPLLLF